jgi:hypothetical protein
MEGIVAKQASAAYTPDATTWVKIKNRQYSQAVGCEDFSTARRYKNNLALPMSLFRVAPTMWIQCLPVSPNPRGRKAQR